MPKPILQRFWRSADLPFVESRCAHDSAACYAPHAHPTLSLGAVDAGSSLFHHGQHRRTLKRGDVVFIPDGEVHACNPLSESAWSYQMLYLDKEWVAQIIGENTDKPNNRPIAPRTELSERSLYNRLTRVNATLFGKASPQEKEAALILFVGDLFATEARKGREIDASDKSASLARVKAMIESRCRETLSLDELAREGGLSRYHLLRAFRRWTGMTPHAWQLDLRIQQARRLLREGMPLAETALHLGFADQSHFQRAFKQRVAATPGEYCRLPERNFVQDPTTITP